MENKMFSTRIIAVSLFGGNVVKGFRARAGEALVRLQTLSLWRKLLAALVFVCAGSVAHAMTYQYDAAGRLISATNASGETAVYNYDSRGNLLSIARITGGPLNIASFSPQFGEPGVQVRIYGSGFSTTPANNDVEFNGTDAAVLSATSNELLVQVPVGATTGTIEVTVGANSVTSINEFEVNTLGLAPVISSISPTKGNPGASITITGSHFEPFPDLTAVEINGIYVPVTSLTDVQIVFTVPAWVGSGPLTITTAFGKTVASSPFLVVPTGMATADVTDYSLLALGSSQAISLPAASKYGALTFEGHEGDYMNLQISSLTSSINAVTYTIYSPTNTVIASGTITSTAPTVLLPVLTRDGVYSVFFGSGAGTASLTATFEISPTLTVDGATINLATSTNRQKKRFIFSATSGANLGGAVPSMTGSSTVILSVYKPDGNFLVNTACTAAWGCHFNIASAPATGTYVVIFDPGANATFSVNVLMSTDVTGTLAADTPQTISIARRGQNARYSFSATAGSNKGLRIDSISTTPSNSEIYLKVYKPDGSQFLSVYTTYGTTFPLANLPATGTYQVFVDDQLGATFSPRLTILKSEANELVKDSSSISRSSSIGYESFYFSFAGTAGENLGLGLSSLSGSFTVMVYKPNGTTWLNTGCSAASGGCDINLTNLPTTGTYVAVAYGSNSTPIGFTAALSSDLTGTLAADTPQTISISRRGQNARYTFSGTAGMYAGLQFDGISTTPSGKWVYVTVYKPDGSSLTSDSSTSASLLKLTNLPTTGTYTVVADPYIGSTTSVRLNLVTSATAAVTVDGSSLSVSTPAANVNAYFNFVATSGANLGVGISSLTMSSGTQAGFHVFAPNGSEITYISCYTTNDGCETNIANATAGTYAVTMVPASGATESFTATVSSDATGSLTGTSQTFSTSRRGQNGRYTFSGTSGTSVSIPITSISTAPSGKNVYFRVLKPDGSQLSTGTATGSYTFNLSNLPATGTYTLTADPYYGATASFNALVQ